jgi:hypothetical protein
MLCALRRFIGSKSKLNYKISSRDYEKIKIEHAIMCSNHLTGKKHSDEARKNMSIAQQLSFQIRYSSFKGKKHTKETKSKMRNAQLGSKNHQFGKKRSEVIKRAISKKMKGRKLSEEHIKKFKSRKLSLETKNKIREKVKKQWERTKESGYNHLQKGV